MSAQSAENDAGSESGHPAGKSEGQAVTPVWTAPTKLPLDAAPGTCPAQTGPVWKLGGEACGCTLNDGHDGDHECGCGSWWVDSVRRDIPPAKTGSDS